jgi:hypothetical protein
VRKIEGSEWRCIVPSRESETGTCDVVVEQTAMEAHLRAEHKRSLLSPGDVIPFFVLVRGAPSRGRPPGLGKVDDDTLTMFDREDFR